MRHPSKPENGARLDETCRMSKEGERAEKNAFGRISSDAIAVVSVLSE